MVVGELNETAKGEIMTAGQFSCRICLVLLVVGLALAIGRSIQTAAAPVDPSANAGWVEIGVGSASGGGISNSSGSSRQPSLAVTPAGVPIVAWVDTAAGNSEIYVRRWNGSAWVEMGGSASGGGVSANSGESDWPSVAIDTAGRPIIAWQDNSSGKWQIYVRRWNGAAWVEMGGSASDGGISNNNGASIWPSLRISAVGVPFVVWEDTSDGDREIYLKRWDGSAWVEMGGSASGGGISDDSTKSRRPSVGFLTDGNPVIAWENSTDTIHDIFVRRWNGLAWVEMGSGSASGGGISNDSGFSYWSSLIILPDGMPFVTWGNDPTGYGKDEIFARRWNGTAWVEMAGSATGGGISKSPGESWYASPALAPDGNPMVAWQDNSVDDEEIYFRKWNGSAWVELGPGSATGGGISDDDAGDYSLFPSLAAAVDGTLFVAWNNLTEGGRSDIFVRRYLTTPTCYTLTRTHTGQGSDPTASPANSAGCSAGQYTAGQVITLTAEPAAGWRIAGWSGTSNDNSTSVSNSLTMPANAHAVGVTYEVIPGDTHRIFLPEILFGLPCFAGPDEVEPNNDPATANGPLCRGLTIRGFPNDRFDYFRIDTTLSGSIGVTVTEHFGEGVQLGLYYFDTRVASDTIQGDGLQIQYEPAQPGTYYIIIYTAQPKPLETRRYLLAVSFP